MAPRTLRNALLLPILGAVAFGCARGPTPEPLLLPGPRRLMVGQACPYSTVYVSVRSNGDRQNGQVAERVGDAYADSLTDSGFRVVSTPDEAYWSAFSLVSVSGRVNSIFAWSVYMMATHSVAGELQTPLRFAAKEDDPAQLNGFMFLKEVRLRELDNVVRAAATETASALVPHALQMCITWTEDEAVKQALADEMERIREAKLQRRLQIGAEEPSNP